MLLQFPYARTYFLSALEGSPAVFEHLLQGLTEQEMDYRPDPERFTIREIIAHLAEWEVIYLERMRRARDEEHPVLPNLDESQLATDHGYAHSNLEEQFALFRERRSALLSFLRSCGDVDWQRTANRPEIGSVTIEALALLIPLHDVYHQRQIIEWRSLTAPRAMF